ncbi:hypothetical protein PR048_004310, partial [Dryococelus australis]
MKLSSVHVAIQVTRRECSVLGRKCNKCGRLNHFAVGCRVRQVRALQASQDSDSDRFQLHSLKVVGSVNSHTSYVPKAQDPHMQWKEVLKIEHKNVVVKLDTGSETEVDKNFRDIPNCIAYIDDLICSGETEEEHDRAVKIISRTDLVSQAPCLRSSDASLSIILQCDASQSGLGPCLLQEGQPVAFAYRKLTESECNWAQVEKELLAIVYGGYRACKTRPQMLSIVHEGHGAVGRCLTRDGSIMYWTGWVEMYVKQCKSCEKYAPRNKKHEYHARYITTLPYERVSSDILAFGDNIPLNSTEFRNFAKDRFELQFSSPRYAQSNGLAEKGVHIAKQFLRKCWETDTDCREALREYCNTPIPGIGSRGTLIGDRDSSEKTISTMQDAVERKTALSEDEENLPGWSESDIHVQQ